MARVVLEMDHVFKKFKRGEMHDSLRDLLPALAGRWLKPKEQESLHGREFWALHDVSFAVEAGEALGIIGPNGAGKSTILKLLSGIMKPTVGSVTTHGRLSALIEVGAGFHPDLTGRENVFLNGTVLGMSRTEIKSKFDEIVAFSGLEEFIDTPVKRYSSGMYARLGFSVASHVDPDVLIVDEVLSVGDGAFQHKCLQRMNAVLAKGTTVIFVSHNLKAVSDLCSKALFLMRGSVASIGATDDVVRHYLYGETGKGRDTEGRDVFVSNVLIRNAAGERGQFEPGDKVWVDVEITARQDCTAIDIIVGFNDRGEVSVFSSSMEGLGFEPFKLKAGQQGVCSFELTLHLAPGTYNLYAHTERHGNLKAHDYFKTNDCYWNAATVYIKSNLDVRGSANLYPSIDPNSIKVVTP